MLNGRGQRAIGKRCLVRVLSCRSHEAAKRRHRIPTNVSHHVVKWKTGAALGEAASGRRGQLASAQGEWMGGHRGDARAVSRESG